MRCALSIIWHPYQPQGYYRTHCPNSLLVSLCLCLVSDGVLWVVSSGLSQHQVTDYKQTLALLERGIGNRITAATHIHDASSRSHAIFTIQYTQVKTSLTHTRAWLIAHRSHIPSQYTHKCCLLPTMMPLTALQNIFTSCCYAIPNMKHVTPYQPSLINILLTTYSRVPVFALHKRLLVMQDCISDSQLGPGIWGYYWELFSFEFIYGKLLADCGRLCFSNSITSLSLNRSW